MPDLIRMKSPVHPGSFILKEIIEPTGLNISESAKALGVTRVALSSLVNSRSSLSAEMALRLEKTFGVNMDTLMRMQNSYDISRIRQRENEINVNLVISTT